METDWIKLKDLVGIISGLASACAILGATWWFFVTTKYKQRIQFDLDCNFLSFSEEVIVAELQFVFENKGFIEHRLYDLNLSVHTWSDGEVLEEKDKTKELIFDKSFMSRVLIVPPHYNYYFVRPGVRQIITHTIQVPKRAKIMRVTASFNYVKNGRYPHTARRVFEVKPKLESLTQN